MSLATRKKVAFAASLLILGAATWFWWGQILEVLELLELAYGE